MFLQPTKPYYTSNTAINLSMLESFINILYYVSTTKLLVDFKMLFALLPELSCLQQFFLRDDAFNFIVCGKVDMLALSRW